MSSVSLEMVLLESLWTNQYADMPMKWSIARRNASVNFLAVIVAASSAMRNAHVGLVLCPIRLRPANLDQVFLQARQTNAYYQLVEASTIKSLGR
jgi:hypothetical protein